MKPLVIHAEAEAEIREAAAFYEGRRKGLGRAFLQELETVLNHVRRAPEAFAPVDEQGTRKHRFPRFPYSLYYVELDTALWVAAVAHRSGVPVTGRAGTPILELR